MASRKLPGIALNGFWNLGDQWKEGGDENWLKLSVLVHLSALSVTTNLPGSPQNGDVYILDHDAEEHPNSVAVFDADEWWYFEVPEGAIAFIKDSEKHLTFVNDEWVPVDQMDYPAAGIPISSGDGWSGAVAPESFLYKSEIGTEVFAYDSSLDSFLTDFTLPTEDGQAGWVLSTDGSGKLTFKPESGGGGGGGTVTSVALSVPTGLSVSGSPVTDSGTIAISYQSGYSIPTTAKQSQWDTAYSWGNHAEVGYLTSVSWEDIDGAPTIPTKVSDLENDSGFLSSVSWSIVTDKPAIPEKVSELENDSGFLTSVSWNIVTDKPTIPTKVSDLTNDSGFISAESDPIFSASAAAGISSADLVNWNTAYSWGNHADAGYLTDDDIGVTVQGYDEATAKTDEANTWLELQTFKSTKDTIYTITDGPTVDINPANGGIQIWALGGNRTPTATNFENGQSVTLMIDDGAAYTITWAIVDKWFGGAPTLSTDELTGIVLFKAGGVMYGTTLPEVAA